MKRMMWTIGLTLVFLSTNSIAASVIRDGKEWLQPADFTGLSWDDVEAVCKEAQGFLCDGELNEIDVTGYTFASIEQVTYLFNSYGIDPPLGPPQDEHREINSDWAPSFFNDFLPTIIRFPRESLQCWSSSPVAKGQPGTPYIEDKADTFYDFVSNSSSDESDEVIEGLGVCLYRDVPTTPKAVPTMSTYVLIFTMLGLIAIASGGLFRRKFKDG